MPAGRGNQCLDCYYLWLADKRRKLDCAAFSSPKMAKRFDDFGIWLRDTRGAKKAAHNIHGYLPFFLQVEHEWDDVPGYGKLLAHFGAKRLRKVLLPIKWMEEAGLITADTETKEADSDRRRIDATLSRFPRESTASELLNSYHSALAERLEACELTIRSVRLALTPAAGLLKTAMGLGRDSPDQQVLDLYFAKAPGQRAGVSGFLTHLRDAQGIALTLPKGNPHSARQKRRQALKQELLGLMRGDSEDVQTDERWIGAALAYFHDVPRKKAKAASLQDATQDEGGLRVRIGEDAFWIPLRIQVSDPALPFQ